MESQEVNQKPSKGERVRILRRFTSFKVLIELEKILRSLR